MASSADIETALVNAIAGMLYPASAPAFDGKVTVARGWPTEADIRNATANGANLVGVYAVAESALDVTKAMRNWQMISPGCGALEVGRVKQNFRLDIWAATPDARDAMLNLLETTLKFTIRYPLPDGSTATLMNMRVAGPNDRPSRVDEWAQSIELQLQYPLLYAQAQPVVTSINIVETTLSADGLPITSPSPASIGAR